ncbi:hypothetical protein B0H13DRAFT_2356290 [Mycena leptocephala]|nr:hypothetical protein B0H13DRAFT_2356290 [Mycena leptocephala]
MSHDAYSPPAAPTIPQAPAPTAVNSVTLAAIASVASASPEPIYIEDDIRGLASWNLDCVTIGRPELSEHAPSAAEHCPDAATADLVPAAESDSQSTAVSQDRVVGDPSTVGPVAAAALATVSSSDWTAVVVTSQDRVVDELSTIDPIASPALPSSNSTGVMAPQDRAGHDEDSDKPAPDKGKARQVIPDLFETPATPSPTRLHSSRGPTPSCSFTCALVGVMQRRVVRQPCVDVRMGGEECVRPSSMGPGTRVTPARSTPRRRVRVPTGSKGRWSARVGPEDEEGEEARQGERAAFRWKSSGDDRPQPQEAVTARQLRAAPGPSFSTSPGGQSARSSPLPTCSIRYNFARARVHHQTLFCIVSTLDLSVRSHPSYIVPALTSISRYNAPSLFPYNLWPDCPAAPSRIIECSENASNWYVFLPPLASPAYLLSLQCHRMALVPDRCLLKNRYRKPLPVPDCLLDMDRRYRARLIFAHTRYDIAGRGNLLKIGTVLDSGAPYRPPRSLRASDNPPHLIRLPRSLLCDTSLSSPRVSSLPPSVLFLARRYCDTSSSSRLLPRPTLFSHPPLRTPPPPAAGSLPLPTVLRYLLVVSFIGSAHALFTPSSPRASPSRRRPFLYRRFCDTSLSSRLLALSTLLNTLHLLSACLLPPAVGPLPLPAVLRHPRGPHSFDYPPPSPSHASPPPTTGPSPPVVMRHLTADTTLFLRYYLVRLPRPPPDLLRRWFCTTASFFGRHTLYYPPSYPTPAIPNHARIRLARCARAICITPTPRSSASVYLLAFSSLSPWPRFRFFRLFRLVWLSVIVFCLVRWLYASFFPRKFPVLVSRERIASTLRGQVRYFHAGRDTHLPMFLVQFIQDSSEVPSHYGSSTAQLLKPQTSTHRSADRASPSEGEAIPEKIFPYFNREASFLHKNTQL